MGIMCSGASASAADPAPNAEARCAQQAVKLLSDYLAGYYKLLSATAHVIQKPLVAGGPSDSQQQTTPSAPQLPSLQALSTPLSGVMSGIDSTCDKVSDDPQQRLPSVDGLASTSSVEDLHRAATQHNGNSADSQHTGPARIRNSRHEACRAVEVQQCTGMWAEACDQHFPQVTMTLMCLAIDQITINLHSVPLQRAVHNHHQHHPSKCCEHAKSNDHRVSLFRFTDSCTAARYSDSSVMCIDKHGPAGDWTFLPIGAVCNADRHLRPALQYLPHPETSPEGAGVAMGMACMSE